MRNNYFKILMFIAVSVSAQNQGDIAFVGYNGDGDDDFSIVTFIDIPENSILYFTDGEPNAEGTGIVDDSEGVITWYTGSEVILAGTVIIFTDVGNVDNPLYGVSVGVIERSEAGFGLAVGEEGDNIFVTLGNPSTNNVTIWLTGIEVHDNGRPVNFEQTGLIVGENYLVIDDTQSKDGGKYNGVTVGKTTSEYSVLVNNEENWLTNTSDGEAILPFSSAPFELISLFVSLNTIDGIALFVQNQKIMIKNGEILSIYSMLGKQVVNQNLCKGVYIVNVKRGSEMASYKLAI